MSSAELDICLEECRQLPSPYKQDCITQLLSVKRIANRGINQIKIEK